MLNGKTILITGGTGSFGKKCVEIILKRYTPKRLIIFSRDELKQYEMSLFYSTEKFPSIRYFVGDVRDKERLQRAFQGVDFIIHAAALKQVPTCEYNPTEAIKTNIYGAQNIINVAADCGVEKIIALSTDKACNPVNLYGATKLCSDKLFVAANNFVSRRNTRFSVVRYGNVVGSRGSVIPFFIKKRTAGVFPITDPRMTRFWITLEQGVNFVLEGFKEMKGGEIFVPKLPSMNIIDLADAIDPDCRKDIIGIRPGEKLHELMISRDDARNTLERKEKYVIMPDWWRSDERYASINSENVSVDFEYSSQTNPWFLSVDEMRELLRNQELEL